MRNNHIRIDSNAEQSADPNCPRDLDHVAAYAATTFSAKEMPITTGYSGPHSAAPDLHKDPVGSIMGCFHRSPSPHQSQPHAKRSIRTLLPHHSSMSSDIKQNTPAEGTVQVDLAEVLPQNKKSWLSQWHLLRLNFSIAGVLLLCMFLERYVR